MLIQEMVQEVVQQATIAQPKDHNHVLIALWAVVGGLVIETVVLAILIKARGGWAYVATIPLVNLRQLVSIALAVVTVIGTGIVGYLSGVWPPEYVLEYVLFALTIWMGIDVAQFWIKRKTTDNTIQSTQNIMAAQAAGGVQVDAQAARNQAAPESRQSIPGQTTEMNAGVAVGGGSGEKGD